MSGSRNIINIGHFAFWITNFCIQYFLSEEVWYVDLLSVLLYANAFYINYFVILPLMPKKKPQQGLIISFTLYLVLSISQNYPIYELLGDLFVPLHLVGKGHIVGGILHLSFFFYAVSTLSWIAINEFKRQRRKQKSSIKRVDDDIQEIRYDMSFSLTNSVLKESQKIAADNPEKVAPYISKLSKVLRYKLHKETESNTLLSDEITHIQDYLDLLNQTENTSWKVMMRDDAWIKNGKALRKVEDLLMDTTQKGGTIMINSDDYKISVTLNV